MFKRGGVGIFVTMVILNGCINVEKTVTEESFNVQKRDFFIESQKPIEPKIKELKKELSSLVYREKWKEAKELISKQDDLSTLSRVDYMFKVILTLIRYEKIDILEQLVDKNFSIPMVEWSSHYKFIEEAHSDKRWRSLKFLMTKGGYPFDKKIWLKSDGYKDYRAMQDIVKSKDIDLLKWLIEKKIPVKAKYYKGDSPLIMAVKEENLKMIKILVKAGANPNYISLQEESAVALAQKSKDSAIQNYFKGEINSKSFSIDFLNKAIEKKDLPLIKKIIASGLNINKKSKGYYKKTPLEVAIDRGTTKIVNYLLDNGADINYPFGEYNQYTALYEMVSEDNGVELVRSAIKHGADVNAKVNNRISVLGRALNSGKTGLACAKLLVENSVILNEVTTYDKQLPLHTALEKEDEALSKLILNRMVKEGAKNLLSNKDESGNTPLHYAIWSDFEDIINQLIKLGVDTKAKNIEGLEPIAYSNSAKVLNKMELLSSDKASIGQAYCMVKVKGETDKSKSKHCNTIAKHYADIENHSDAIKYYFLANNLDAIKEYSSNDDWITKCNCKGYYAYFDIASAYLLSNNQTRAKEFYKKLLIAFYGEDETWLGLKFKLLEHQHKGYGIKAKEIWSELWKEKYKEEFFKESK